MERIDRVVKQAKQARQRDAQILDELCVQREKAKATIRVWGPYQDSPNRFRLKFSEGEVIRSVCYPTLQEAESVKETLLAKYTQTTSRTIGEVVSEWIVWMRQVRGVQPITTEWLVTASKFLPSDAVMEKVTDRDALKIYQHHATRVSPHTGRPLSPATHHLFLWAAKRLWTWAIEQGYCKVNPWLKVTPIGKKPSGKPQLRIDEARRLEAVALERAEQGDIAALGTLLMIYLGLRQGEVCARVARDIDDGGRVLWVPSGKTKNARRRLKIPDQLQKLVLKVAQNRRPDELLFYPSSHKSHHREYYRVRVKRLCRLAGVPEVVPHSLRGLHATLALDGGATSDAVARALGHSSFAMTEQHYASPSAVSNARSSRVSEALAQHIPNGDSLSTANQIADLLKDLAPEVVSALLAQVKSTCDLQRQLDDNQPT